MKAQELIAHCLSSDGKLFEAGWRFVPKGKGKRKDVAGERFFRKCNCSPEEKKRIIAGMAPENYH